MKLNQSIFILRSVAAGAIALGLVAFVLQQKNKQLT